MNLTLTKFALHSSIFVIFVTGCSNDVDLLLPASPIPNIICIVYPQDSFCYLTISKTAQVDGNITGLIDNNDHLRVDDAKVVLEIWGGGYQIWESTFSLIGLESSLGEDLLKSRSCYKSDHILLLPGLVTVDDYGRGPYDFLRLRISAPEFNTMTYARIPFFKGPALKGPYTPIDFNLYGQEYSNLQIRLNLNEIKYASLSCRFYYEEYTDHWHQTSVQFVVQKNIALLDNLVIMHIYEEFFYKLASAMPEKPEVYARRFNHMDFSFVASDKYFFDYFSTYINASNFDMPCYSNITNGFGIFSMARRVDFPPLDLDAQSLDSLCFGRITKQLKFRKDLQGQDR